MAGHNKFNNIKNRKAAQDQRRSKAFFDVTKMIRVAVKQSGDGNPDSNPALRLAVEKARSVNMPKENVQRAINRALGKNDSGQSIQEVVYEGYAPHGVGIIVVASTDNVQRTASTMRFIFSRNGGSLGSPGSAAFLFAREGAEYVPTIPMDLTPEQGEAVQQLIDSLTEDEDVEEVFTNGVWPQPEEDDNASS